MCRVSHGRTRVDDDNVTLGPSGWTRTTTARVKEGPHAPVDTERTGAGSAYGYRTRPPLLATRNAPPHQAERGPVGLTGPIDIPVNLPETWRVFFSRQPKTKKAF